MNVLLTGALGTVGQHALAELRKAGHQVRVLELPSPRNQKLARRLGGQGVEWRWGDIRDEAGVAKAVEGCEAVAHLAAIIPPMSDFQPELARAVNVGGTENVLKGMKASGARRLVYSSSVAVYARSQPRPPPRTADDPTAGTDPYSHHKLECERAIRASGLDFCILRFGAVLPPAIPPVDVRVQIRMAFDIPVDQRIETVDAQDAGLAVANAASSPEVGGKTLLVGGGKGSQMLFREYMAELLAAMGLKMFPDDAFGLELYHTDWMDTAEAQRLLRFQRHTFQDFLQRYRASRLLTRAAMQVLGPLVWRFMLRQSPHYQRARELRAPPGTQPGVG